MGQRLNIEIRSKNKTLANCYYHWSGYTMPASYLTMCILEGIRTLDRELVGNDKKYAALLLASTGGRLEDKQEAYAKKYNFTDEEIKKLSDGANKNEGLIALRPIAAKLTRRYEEARVMIDIDKKFVNFQTAMWLDKDEADYKTLHKFPYPIQKIPFEEYEKFDKFLEDLYQKDIFDFIAGKHGYTIIA